MKKFLVCMLVFVVLLGFTKSVKAQISYIVLKVGGLHCPLCSYELGKKIAKIKGVSTYDVDMKNGKFFVRLKAPVKLSSIYKTVYLGGYFLKDVYIRVKGRIYESEEGLKVIMTEKKQKFVLYESESLLKKFNKGEVPKLLTDKMRKKLRGFEEWGKEVLVEGYVHKHGKVPFGLLIKSIKPLD